jgi:hypothetical protein
MTLTAARMMDFFDRHVGELIHTHYGYSEIDALRLFMGSETYRMLSDDDLKLWHFSPLAIFDMWENERMNGDPRSSVYISG